jgi:probable selenium-dependent hydroxylase accessory protein YqeC
MGLLCNALDLQGRGVVSLVGGGGKTTLMFELARELSLEGCSVLSTTTTRIYNPVPEQSGLICVSEDLPGILEKLDVPVSAGLHVTAAGGELAAENKLMGYTPQQIDAVQETGFFKWIIVEADGARQLPLKAPAAHEPVIPGSSGWVIGMIGLSAIGKPLDDRHVFRSREYSLLTGIPMGAPVTTESAVRAILAPNGILKGFPAGSKRIVFLNGAEDPERRAAGCKIARLLSDRGEAGIHRIVVGSLRPGLLIVEIVRQ